MSHDKTAALYWQAPLLRDFSSVQSGHSCHVATASCAVEAVWTCLVITESGDYIFVVG